MRHILVTGATGGLGRNAVRILLERGIKVRASGRNTKTGKQLSDMGAEFVCLDLAQATPRMASNLVDSVDAIWHCAALSAPWGRQADFVASNVNATQLLLDVAGRHEVKRFVHISTPAIYFDYSDHFDISETFRPASYVNAYAQTKAQAEQLVQRAVTQFPHMRCTILRPRAIFGPHDQVLIPRLLSILQAHGGKLPLPKGGKVTLDVTYVENVVHAMWLATNKTHMVSGMVFNITNHEPALLCDVLQALFGAAMQHPFQIVTVPYPLLAGVARCMQFVAHFTRKEPALSPYSLGAINYHMTLDNLQAKQYLGYLPPVTLTEGICRTASWLRNNNG